MATIYAPPEDPPDMMGDDCKDENGRLDWKKYEDVSNAYIERMQQAARDASPGDEYAGVIYRTPVADGYAMYIVWRSKPLQLIHLKVWDGWQAPAALERGLRLTDIKQQVGFEKAWRELSEKQKAKANV